MYNKAIRSDFLEKIKEYNLNVYFNRNNYFILIQGNDSSRIVCVELICSTKVIPQVHGSHNNTSVTSIGRFKFNIPKWEDKIHYYVFAFLNTENHNIEYVIAKDEILRNRFQKRNRIPQNSKKAELTFWLMPEHKVYDTTNISIEGEWYWLSGGVNGRMADGKDMDYSECLNNFTAMVEAVRGKTNDFTSKP